MLARRQHAVRHARPDNVCVLKLAVFQLMLVCALAVMAVGASPAYAQPAGPSFACNPGDDDDVGNEFVGGDLTTGPNDPATRLQIVKDTLGREDVVEVACDFSPANALKGTWSSSDTVTHIFVKAGTPQAVFDIDPDGTSGQWSTSCIRNNGGQQPAVSGVFCYRVGQQEAKGTITVVKKTENGFEEFDFSLTGDSTNETFSLDTATTNPISSGAFTLDAGKSYTISETNLGDLTDWDLSNITCTRDSSNIVINDPSQPSVTIDNLQDGENVTCTFTNTFVGQDTGTIAIKKLAQGGDETFSFSGDLGSFSIEGKDDQTITATGHPVTVAAGTYSVTEIVPVGWNLTSLSCDDGSSGQPSTADLASGTATIKVEPDEDVSCTFTNTKIEDTTIQFAKVLKDPAGNSVTGLEFIFRTNQRDENAQGTTAISGQGFSSSLTIVPGKAVRVFERVPAGVKVTQISCQDQNGDQVVGTGTQVNGDVFLDIPESKVDEGDNWQCTFTNEQIGAEIVIKKEVDPSTSTEKFDFTTDFASGFALGHNETKTFKVAVGGDYLITEVLDVDFDLTDIACAPSSSEVTATPVVGDGEVKISIRDQATSSDTITCIFKNRRKTGTLKVVKETIGGNDDFSFLLTGPEGDSFDLRGGEKKVFSSLPTGQYTITETSLPEGWTLKSVSCGQGVGSENGFTVTLDKNESITCTFVNFKEEDEEMEDITKLFIYRRVDNLLSHDPDRARLLRRLQEQQPVSLKDTALPPLKMTGSMDGESGQVQFSTSLSQMRASMMAQDAAKIRKAQTGDGMKSSFADDPYIAPYMMTRPGWDIWIEGQISRYDDTTAGIERDGIFKILYVGADYAIAPGVIVGALVQVDRTDESVDDPDIWGEIEGTGWMVGPYMGAKISDNLMFDARAAWGQSDNDIQLESEDGGFRTGEFETDRWLVTAKLTGLWHHGGWRISPHVGLAWGNEDQDAYNNSIGQTIGANSITIGRVTFGPEFGYKHMMLDGSVIEPHIAIEGIWNFDGDDLVINGTTVDTDEFRAKVEGGVIFATPDGYKLRAAASYDGLGADDFEAWSAKAWLNIPLDRADDPIQ